MERITATYFIETPFAPEAAATVLAGEQSSGTFTAVPGETEELKQRFAARVESVEFLETVSTPAIPGAESSNHQYHRAIVKISWSIENFGYNLPVLISTLQGNLYEIRQFTGLKLMDIDIPASYANHFSGPKFGIEGCRKLTGVQNRPLIGTIIKPSVGLTPQQTATLVETLANAGIDFIKDDELLSSTANSPFNERVDEVMKVINKHVDKTGKKIMYAFNISGEIDEMLERYEKVVNAGGTCAMISINSVGIAGTKKICDQGALAIHGHRNGWGMLTRHPLLGIDFTAYQKLWRLAGVDQLHVNGIQNKFWESDDSVVQSIKACLKPLLGGYSILPVVSSGQWGGQAPETYRRTQTTDLLYMAGGGILAHPMGPAAGVTALQQAWQAAVDGLGIEDAAKIYPEFAKSVEKFGTK
ncbi:MULTISPECIES: ribulose-bisphosphate carboxylase large subunit family protein [unclassified Arcicella]|uniref:ribulose-bisphosphate carboxylase large subunit family protein n=1 Tax=unclassified Arcicella TaxID=2644986 RepID=UPI0028559255|nr:MULTISPECIES: ribulose-bisphosphate carboxylase large subunit family protein [unclassified Arcicella]MDR6561962.1 ribulose-bisphosphate carboxylase large chain [Arcicella sp. BE51]MDR6811833.1 ribulose-bisphosphate carboxylase large chain [Arcicella sp. BE140]MDR6822863.1 ribulose-bisphosphate carboxylase large chain [Arcicella sp. BE139]